MKTQTEGQLLAASVRNEELASPPLSARRENGREEGQEARQTALTADVAEKMAAERSEGRTAVTGATKLNQAASDRVEESGVAVCSGALLSAAARNRAFACEKEANESIAAAALARKHFLVYGSGVLGSGASIRTEPLDGRTAFTGEGAALGDALARRRSGRRVAVKAPVISLAGGEDMKGNFLREEEDFLLPSGEDFQEEASFGYAAVV